MICLRQDFAFSSHDYDIIQHNLRPTVDLCHRWGALWWCIVILLSHLQTLKKNLHDCSVLLYNKSTVSVPTVFKMMLWQGNLNGSTCLVVIQSLLTFLWYRVTKEKRKILIQTQTTPHTQYVISSVISNQDYSYTKHLWMTKCIHSNLKTLSVHFFFTPDKLPDKHTCGNKFQDRSNCLIIYCMNRHINTHSRILFITICIICYLFEYSNWAMLMSFVKILSFLFCWAGRGPPINI